MNNGETWETRFVVFVVFAAVCMASALLSQWSASPSTRPYVLQPDNLKIADLCEGRGLVARDASLERVAVDCEGTRAVPCVRESPGTHELRSGDPCSERATVLAARQAPEAKNPVADDHGR